MAKRFTDTDKWKKRFIRGLDTPYKVLWLYILDDCNHAGIWEVDIDIAIIKTGCIFDENIAIKKFGDKINVFDNGEKWFIPDFIDFQYGILNPKNRVHESVLALLSKYENKGLIRGLIDPKDKDKEKDKEEVKDKRFSKLLNDYVFCDYQISALEKWDDLLEDEKEIILVHAKDFRLELEKLDKTQYQVELNKYIDEKMFNIPVDKLIKKYKNVKDSGRYIKDDITDFSFEKK